MALEKTSWRAGQAVLLLMMLVCAPAWGGICRVATGGSGFNDGSDWAVPVSLTQAFVASSICTEIWAKKGLYKPTTGADSTIPYSPATK